MNNLDTDYLSEKASFTFARVPSVRACMRLFLTVFKLDFYICRKKKNFNDEIKITIKLDVLYDSSNSIVTTYESMH